MTVMVSARVKPSERDKLRQSGYSTRQAIEYFNKIALDEQESLKIEEHFLIEDIKKLELKIQILKKQLEEIREKELWSVG